MNKIPVTEQSDLDQWLRKGSSNIRSHMIINILSIYDMSKKSPTRAHVYPSSLDLQIQYLHTGTLSFSNQPFEKTFLSSYLRNSVHYYTCPTRTLEPSSP